MWETISQRIGPAGVKDFVPSYGRRGAITDDTQVTMFTAEGLIRASVRQRERGICHLPSVIRHADLRWLWTQGDPVPLRREFGAPKLTAGCATSWSCGGPVALADGRQARMPG